MTRALLLVLLLLTHALAAIFLLWTPPHPLQIALLILLALFAGLSLFAWRRLSRHLQRQQSRVQELLNARDDLQLAHRHMERHTRHLIEGLPLPMIICAADAQVLYVNERALNWFDYRDFRGKSILALSFSYELYTLFQKCVKRGAPLSAEIHLTNPQERVALTTIWQMPAPDQDQQVYAVVLMDQTDLLRMEQVRRDFVANVSHEFRTPLASVRAIAETLLDDPAMPAPTRERFLHMVVAETDRLARIADDLLILTRAESRAPERELLDLAPLIHNLTEQMRTEAQEAQVEMENHLPTELLVFANRDQMIQVMMNLLSNAIRYNRPGGKVITRGCRQQEYVLIEVEDTGIGIMSDDLPRIFERFYRVDKARSRDTGGTGLGLAIVKHIVEAHGGKVEVQSEYRQGTTMRALLPGDIQDISPPEASDK